MPGTNCECEVGYHFVNDRCVEQDACDLFPCDRRSPLREVRFVEGTCTDLAAPAPGNESSGRQCSCPTPFVGDGDPAQLGCSCPTGLRPNIEETECVRVDACDIAPCGQADETCTVIVGGAPNANGRTCSCDPATGVTGSSLNLQTGELMPPCRNINACAAFPCPNDALGCQDLPPPAPNTTAGRICNCGVGRELAENGGAGACVDIDSCANATCGDGEVCLDQPAPGMGFTCTDPCAMVRVAVATPAVLFRRFWRCQRPADRMCCLVPCLPFRTATVP